MELQKNTRKLLGYDHWMKTMIIYDQSHDRGDGIWLYISVELIKLRNLNICSLSYVNCTLIEWLKMLS